MTELEYAEKIKAFMAALRAELERRYIVDHVSRGRPRGHMAVHLRDGSRLDVSARPFEGPLLTRVRVGGWCEFTMHTTELDKRSIRGVVNWCLLTAEKNYFWTQAAAATLPEIDQKRFQDWDLIRDVDLLDPGPPVDNLILQARVVRQLAREVEDESAKELLQKLAIQRLTAALGVKCASVEIEPWMFETGPEAFDGFLRSINAGRALHSRNEVTLDESA